MSEIVTFKQAMKLKKLGYDLWSIYSYNKNDITFQKTPKVFTSEWTIAPTIPEALDWLREEKGIECAVYPIMERLRDGLQKISYSYKSFDLNKNCKRLHLDLVLLGQDTHYLAENALLNAVLTYLEQNN